MTAILEGRNIDLSSSSKSGVSMPPSLTMFVENRELLMLLTTSISPQNLAIFEASESLRSFISICFTVSSMEFEGFYGVGWRSPVSVKATATPGLERFHRKIATMGLCKATRQQVNRKDTGSDWSNASPSCFMPTSERLD